MAILFRAQENLSIRAVEHAKFLFLRFEKAVECEFSDVLVGGSSRAVRDPVGLLRVDEVGQTVAAAGAYNLPLKAIMPHS